MNDHLHPVIRNIVNGWLPQKQWVVQIKRGAEVVREFNATGFYRTQVQREHEDLADESRGEQCIVLTPEERSERLCRCGIPNCHPECPHRSVE